MHTANNSLHQREQQRSSSCCTKCGFVSCIIGTYASRRIWRKAGSACRKTRGCHCVSGSWLDRAKIGRASPLLFSLSTQNRAPEACVRIRGDVPRTQIWSKSRSTLARQVGNRGDVPSVSGLSSQNMVPKGSVRCRGDASRDQIWTQSRSAGSTGRK